MEFPAFTFPAIPHKLKSFAIDSGVYWTEKTAPSATTTAAGSSPVKPPQTQRTPSRSQLSFQDDYASDYSTEDELGITGRSQSQRMVFSQAAINKASSSLGDLGVGWVFKANPREATKGLSRHTLSRHLILPQMVFFCGEQILLCLFQRAPRWGADPCQGETLFDPNSRISHL